MPNIASVMREEITRLSRRASRKDLDAIKKAAAQQRRYIAHLKRQLVELARQVSVLARRSATASVVAANGSSGKPLRFVAKGLRSHRERLGVSAGELAKLVGVSSQTIYNWEHEVTRPRQAQIGALAALRGLGKREIRARLEQADGEQPATHVVAVKASRANKRSMRRAPRGKKK